MFRFGTISHILASTELNCSCSKKEDVQSDQDLIEKNAVEIVKQMQRLKGIDGDYDSDSAASNRLAHRRTIQNLERTRQNKKRAIGTLDVAFKKRFFALSGEDEAPLMDGHKQSSRKFHLIQQFLIQDVLIPIIQHNYFGTPCIVELQ